MKDCGIADEACEMKLLDRHRKVNASCKKEEMHEEKYEEENRQKSHF